MTKYVIMQVEKDGGNISWVWARNRTWVFPDNSNIATFDTIEQALREWDYASCYIAGHIWSVDSSRYRTIGLRRETIIYSEIHPS